MTSRFVLKCGRVVKLKHGTYCWEQLVDIGLAGAKVKEIYLKSASIIITRCSDVIFMDENDTNNPTCVKVCIRIREGTKIVVTKLCTHETPCDEREKWDYIIVGLGSAGSILARKLSDDLRTKVLVIETGKSHQTDPITLSPNWISNASTLLYNPKYAVTYPVMSSNPFNPLGAYVYSEGVGWGGSSSHNFMIAVRGTPYLYDTWATLSGNPTWSYANMLPRMKALEHYFPDPSGSGDPAQRGFGGPISVTQSPPLTQTPLLNALSAAFNAPYTTDYNNPDLGVVGTAANQEFKTPAPTSRRSYSNLEFLPIGTIVDKYGNGLGGRKLKIVSNARVLKFDTRNTFGPQLRATSVKYVYTGSEYVVLEALLTQKGTLILTSGSINTPRILLSSGIGPAAELEALGIPVKVDSPNVGKNLQDQYGSYAIVTGAVDNLSQVYTDVAYPPDGIRRVQLANIEIRPGITQIIPALLNPKSIGSVTVVDANPLVKPMVTIGIYTDGDETVAGSDLNLMVDVYNKIKIAAVNAGENVISPPPAVYAGGDADLAAYAKTDANVIVQSHNVGTTRMGTSIATSVVDGNLSVYGLQNVKVGDVSIEPVSVDGNTCYSAYYIALTLCEILGVPA